MREPPTARPPFDPAAFAKEAELRLGPDEPSSRRVTPRAFPAPSLDAGRTNGSHSPTSPPAPGSLGAETIPVLVMSREELEWFALSPTASRLIAQLDGVSSVAAVCSGADVPRAEGHGILLELSEQGIVAFR